MWQQPREKRNISRTTKKGYGKIERTQTDRSTEEVSPETTLVPTKSSKCIRVKLYQGQELNP